jgi:Glycosyl hydrolases family 18
MRRRRPLRALLAGVTTGAASAGLVATGGGAAHAVSPPLPAHVSAPYFETWTGDSPAALAAQSGNKYLTLAFLQTEKAGSCTAYWNGDTTQPVSQAVLGKDIATIQARGGNVIPSFGGYSADTTSTDIADSCASVDGVAAVYESLVTTYHVPRIDLDVEADSLGNTAAIDRRNKAIAKVERWAARTGRHVRFSYTLPTSTKGLESDGLAVLRNAAANHARVDVVNIMTFDYYDGADPHDMAADTVSAATALHGQLASLHPGQSSRRLWNTIGVTEMPGIDDYGPAETFTTANAAAVERWAAAKGLGTLSFWALQRDNGGCPGTGGANECSGIDQSTWYFSHTFAPFTRW